MSNYPSRTDIVTAMRNPNVSFKSNEIIGGSVIQKGSRIIQYSGGYTTVFPFHKQTGNKVAVRLWIADIGDAKKRSLEISNYLENLNNAYFAGFKYIDDAVLVNGTLHPIVLMDWVDGQILKEYINSNITNESKILGLAESFREMTAYFHKENIAHGDLQHGNILVKSDGSLVAIDYDSMFIEPLNGMPDTIKGLPGYQHPTRHSNQFVNSRLDYFSELVIYLSLLIYAETPKLWDDYYETEDLLFSKDDFANPSNSKLISNHLKSSNPTISELTEKMVEELKATDIAQLRPLEDLLINRREVAKDNIFDKWDKQPNPPQKKQVSLPTKNSIMFKWDLEWWEKLERPWKILLLSNYCFNYDKFNKWTIQDCHLECPGYSPDEPIDEYLIGFALWVGGDLVGGSRKSFTTLINNIPQEILNFIINQSRFIWGSGLKVTTIIPLLNLSTVSEISNLSIALNNDSLMDIKSRYSYVDYNEETEVLNLKK
jgi:serine/threonine protein kinase